MLESDVSRGEARSRVMIEAQGLSKYFGPFVAIEGISFSIVFFKKLYSASSKTNNFDLSASSKALLILLKVLK